MPSIFKDTSFSTNAGLNTFFKEIPAASFSGATSLATALYVGKLDGTATKLFLDNQLNAEVYVVLVAPNLKSDDVNNRTVLLSIAASQTWNLESIAPPHMQIEAGTKIMLYAPSAPGGTKFKIFAFTG